MALANASMIRTGAIATRMAAGVGLAVLGMGIVSVRAAGNFQQAMNIVEATTGSTTKQLALLRAEAIALGRDFKLPNVSARDAAEAMVELGKAGFSTNQILKATRGVLQLGLAANISFADSAVIVARSLKAFNLEGEKAVMVANLLAAGANKSTADITDLAYGMQNASGQFASARMPIQALVVALAELADKGLSGEYAGTALKTMLIRLQSPTKEAAAIMQKLGIEVYNSAGQMKTMPAIIQEFVTGLKGKSDAVKQDTLNTIFGTRANQAMMKLIEGGVPTWNKYKDAIVGTNAAQQMAEARTKGFNGALGALGSAFETLAIQLGTALLPSLEKAVRGMAKFVNEIDPNRIIAVFSAAFGGAQQVVEKFVAFLRTGFGQQVALGVAGTYALVRALAAMRAAVAFVNIALASITRNPFFAALIPLGLLVGNLAMKFIDGKVKAMQLDSALRAAAGGADALKNALDRLKASETGLEGAKINLIRANQAAAAAEAAWKKAVDESGAGSAQARQAYLDYREALNGVKAAQDGVTSAEKEHQAAIKNRNTELVKGNTILFDLVASLQKANGTLAEDSAAKKFADAIKKVGDGARKTASNLAEIDPAASRAKAKTALLADAAVDLTLKLGRVPSKKEIIAEAKAVNFQRFYQELLTAQAKIKALEAIAKPSGYNAGIFLGAGLVSGIRAKIGEVEAAAQAMGRAAVAALNFSAGVSSESKKTRETGMWMGKGLITGFLLGSAELPAKMDEVLRKTLEAARTRISAMQTEFGTLFSRLTSDVLTAFDAMTAAFKTKSEKALEALVAKEAADAAKKRLTDLRDAIKQASDEIVKARQEALAKGLEIEKEFAAKIAEIDKQVAEGAISPDEAAAKKAEAEKQRAEELEKLRIEMGEREKELQKQLAEAKQALQDEKDAQTLEKKKANLEKQAAEERKQYEASRALHRRHLEDQLADLERLLAKFPERHKFYQDRIIKLLKSYGISYKSAGKNLGEAFADGLRESMSAIAQVLRDILGMIEANMKTKSPTKEGPMSDLDRWWEGFAPTLVSGLDTDLINSAVTRAVPTASSAMFDRPTVGSNVTILVQVDKAIGSDLDQAGRELAEPVRNELLAILTKNGYR